MAQQRRTAFETNITRICDACPDDQISVMDRPKTEDTIAKLQRNFEKFETEHLVLIGEAKTAAETTTLSEKYEEIDDRCTAVRIKLIARQLELTQAEAHAQRPMPVDAGQERSIILKSANLMSNITDTWGPFHGDWDKWPDFREKFNANVHENDVLTPVQKCQLLIKACKGAALATIGGKSLAASEANYARAWKRLHEVYTDDYLAVQQTVKQLLSTQAMQEPNHDHIRRMLDTIHEVEGKLSSYFDVEQWHPIILFTCLFRLDPDTYEKWETERATAFRQSEAMTNATGAQAMDDDQNAQGGPEGQGENAKKHNIPSLHVFKQFLETQSRVLIHKMGQSGTLLDSSQSRSRDSSSNRSKQSSKTGAIPKAKPNDQRGAVGGPGKKLALCRMCQEDHGMFSCVIWKAKPFDWKVDYVRRHQLCEVCYHKHGPGECAVKNQRPCTDCPGNPLHNTQLCPTREATRRTTMMSVVGNVPEPLTFSKSSSKRRNDERSDRKDSRNDKENDRRSDYRDGRSHD